MTDQQNIIQKIIKNTNIANLVSTIVMLGGVAVAGIKLYNGINQRMMDARMEFAQTMANNNSILMKELSNQRILLEHQGTDIDWLKKKGGLSISESGIYYQNFKSLAIK